MTIPISSHENPIKKKQSSPTGWWFGTLLLFIHSVGNVIPAGFHIFQRGRSTNNQPKKHEITILYNFSMDCWGSPWPWYLGGVPVADLLDAVDMVGFEAELLQELKEAHRHRKMLIFHDFPMVFFMDFPWEKIGTHGEMM